MSWSDDSVAAVVDSAREHVQETQPLSDHVVAMVGGTEERRPLQASFGDCCCERSIGGRAQCATGSTSVGDGIDPSEAAW